MVLLDFLFAQVIKRLKIWLMCNFTFLSCFHHLWLNVAVVVAPSGMLGRLVGCCPSDLVRQVYPRYFRGNLFFYHVKMHSASYMCHNILMKMKYLNPYLFWCAFWMVVILSTNKHLYKFC